MKKLFTIISVAFVAFMVSCGPSAEEKARMEQARQDSINQVMEIARQDSIMRAEEQSRLDSMATAMQDSINQATADSIANASKPKPKPKPKAPTTPTKPEEVKPGQGRG